MPPPVVIVDRELAAMNIQGTLMAYLKSHMKPSSDDVVIEEQRHDEEGVSYSIRRDIPEALRPMLGGAASVVGQETAVLGHGSITSTTVTPIGDLMTLTVVVTYTGDQSTRAVASMDVAWNKPKNAFLEDLMANTCKLWVNRELDYLEQVA